MTTTANQSLPLLNCLERFEKQSREITNRIELVELFCVQVIPFLAENMFLEDIRKDWSLQRDQMNQRIQEAEEKAIEEVKETFAEVKKDIDNSAGEKTTQKVELIERLISGEERLYGVPLYRILYDELKQLFQILLEAGYVDLCKKHAKLMTHQIYLPKDLNQGEKWALTLKNGRTSKILTAEELEVARRDNEGSL